MRPLYPVLIAALIATGCASSFKEPVLVPAPPANLATTPEGSTAAVSMLADVRVAAIPGAWPGPTAITRQVTPLRLKIENGSDHPILIRYDKMALVGPAGHIFGALPPYSIDATVAQPRLQANLPVISSPGFSSSGFSVAPIYSGIYPGYPVAGGSFFYDPLYYGWYGSHWRRVSLPTPEMLRLALPEGKVAPGGSVDGFIYFEEVRPDAPRVMFRMDMINADSGQDMGTVQIPFVVTDTGGR